MSKDSTHRCARRANVPFQLDRIVSGGHDGSVVSVRQSQVDRRTCASCGRVMEWRAAWAKNWDEVRFCSAACRRRRVDATDRELETTILALLEDRAAGATICPSEAARQVDAAEWAQLMERARSAARRLVAIGVVEITQRGTVVDPSTASGPIRVRLAPVGTAEPELHRPARRRSPTERA